jgi:hypothetical protein
MKASSKTPACLKRLSGGVRSDDIHRWKKDLRVGTPPWRGS